MKNNKTFLAIVHSNAELAIYDRTMLAKITHSTANNDFRIMDSVHELAGNDQVYHSIKGLLSHMEAGDMKEGMPYAIWIRNEEVLEQLDPDSLKALQELYLTYQLPVGVLGDGRLLKKYLQDISGEEVTIETDFDADIQNTVYFSRYSSSGRSADLYLTYHNETPTGDYHFPFNSDSENALGLLTLQNPILNGDFPNPNAASSPTNGDPDLGRGPWLTFGKSIQYQLSNEDVSARIWIDPYRLNDNSSEFDYYLFMINFSHGVNNYTQNCGKVGFFGLFMNLNIECIAPHTKLYNWGPNTSVNEASVGFTIGGGLKGGMDGKKPQGEVGIDASFSVSFSTPEVNITAIPAYGNKDMINWQFTLPKIGWLSPSVPANPGNSAKGYICYPCFIVQVPKDTAPEFAIQPNIEWDLNQPRGTVKKKHTWNTRYVVKFPDLPPQQN